MEEALLLNSSLSLWAGPPILLARPSVTVRYSLNPSQNLVGFWPRPKPISPLAKKNTWIRVSESEFEKRFLLFLPRADWGGNGCKDGAKWGCWLQSVPKQTAKHSLCVCVRFVCLCVCVLKESVTLSDLIAWVFLSPVFLVYCVSHQPDAQVC